MVKTEEAAIPIPMHQTATAPQYWKRPVVVLVRRADCKVVGFVSISKRFKDNISAWNNLRDEVIVDVTRYFGKEPKFIPCDKGELYHRYTKNYETLELRFKFFKMDNGESILMTFHGFPRADCSMKKEFASLYNIAAKAEF